MQRESKQKTTFSILSFIIAILFIIVCGNYVIAANTKNLTQAQVAAQTSDKDSYFWSSKVGDTVLASTNQSEYRQKQWICLSEKNLAYYGQHLSGSKPDSTIIRAIVDVNYSKEGKYSTSLYAQKSSNITNGTNTTDAKKLAYLCYAATVAGGTGLVADEIKQNPSRNALYWFFNETGLPKLVGTFSKKADKYAYSASYSIGKTVLNYANTYSSSEKQSSSANITSSSSKNSDVKIQNGYSYIGPFTMKTSGSITSVTITDGNINRKVAGYATQLGGTVNKTISKIPKNNTKFWIVTQENLTDLKVKVKINTSGAASGGTIVNPKNKTKKTGYIKARIIFIGNEYGQAAAIFYAEPKYTSETKDSVTFTINNDLGKITVSKTEFKAGDEDYAEVENLGFKIYRMDGTSKKYLRVNDSNEIKGKRIIQVGTDSSYNENEENATTFYTSDIGLVSIDNISIEYQYYIQETDVINTDCKLQLYNAVVEPTQNNCQINKEEGIVGPVNVELKGDGDKETNIELVNFSKTGDLAIYKVDNDDYDTKLGNVEFILKSKDTDFYVKANEIEEGKYEIPTDDEGQKNAYVKNEEEATVFKTKQDDGTVEIKGLDTGIYEFVEKNNPNYGYTKFVEDFELEVEDSKISNNEIPNEKQTGNLKIEKKDMDNENRPLAGVSFKLKNETGYILAYDNDGNVQKEVTGTINLGGLEITDNINEATEFKTNENGVIRIYDLLIGDYEVIEVSLGDNFGYELNDAEANGIDPNTIISWESNKGSGTGNTSVVNIVRQTSINTRIDAGTNDEIFDSLNIKNKRVYIKLSGYVWEDITHSKVSEKNDLWQDDEDDTVDKRLANVKITLKKADGTVIDTTVTGTTINSDGQQEEGAYIFGDYLKNPLAKKIKIEDLERSIYRV